MPLPTFGSVTFTGADATLESTTGRHRRLGLASGVHQYAECELGGRDVHVGPYGRRFRLFGQIKLHRDANPRAFDPRQFGNRGGHDGAVDVVPEAAIAPSGIAVINFSERGSTACLWHFNVLLLLPGATVALADVSLWLRVSRWSLTEVGRFDTLKRRQVSLVKPSRRDENEQPITAAMAEDYGRGNSRRFCRSTLDPCPRVGGRWRPGANERITVGVIGIGTRGKLLLDQLPEAAQLVALCDCNLPKAEKYKADKQGNWPVYQDYRKLLDQKDIDAVIVATGDFQRIRPCIHALSGRQGHLRRKAVDAVYPRRPSPGQRRPQAPSHSSGRIATTLHDHEPNCLRTGANRRAGQSSGGAGDELPGPQRISRRSVSGRAGARRLGLGYVAEPGAMAALQR